MSNWGFWEYLAYGCIGLSALMLAIVQGAKDMIAPNWLPAYFSKIPWSYAPIVLFIISVLIFAAKEFGWIGLPQETIKEVQFIKWPDPYRPISIIGKTFINETVVLDGYLYDHCTFTNVTFVYNGTTAIQFSSNKIHGLIKLNSDNPAVSMSVLWISALLGVTEDKLNVIPSPGVIWEPMKRVP